MKRAVVGLVVAAFLIPALLAAQAVTGTIIGVITDSTGSVMPGASVTLTNTGNGLTRTVTTDSSGEFTAPSLPTGSYTVKAELSGFKTATVSDINLGVDQRFRVNMRLEIGAVEESITVTGASPLVQTSSSELGTTVSEEQIKTLPLNGRNFVNLTRTVPGVVRGIPGANIDGAGSLAWRASASFSANGQRPRDNNYMLDGVDNNETWLQTVVLFPSVDALDEFKLQTSTYSAEFGRSLGGVVNLQIKSGTNALHGSGFEFLRNDRFDANNFFNNRAGRDKPPFSQHQFGGTSGGPIVKDKTFYFFDYQGYRVNQGATYLSTVPSAKMRAGDFSELSRVIYDPLTHLPFPGNVIPQARWDPAAKNILNQLIPAPNTGGTVSSTGQIIQNYLINPTLTRQDNQIDLKVDHTLTSDNRFFGRYSYEKTHRVLPATLPHGDAGFTFGAGDGNIKAQGFAFNDTHTFSSSWLNEFRAGWSSIKFFMTPIDYQQNLANAVGIPGINLGTDTTSAFSQIMFTNGGMRNLGANANQPLITNQSDFQIFDNVTRVAGKHTLKAGGSYTHRSREILNADTIVGRFDFNQNLTSNCGGVAGACAPLANSGFDVASFLLGYASNASRTLFNDGTYTELRPEFASYFQDDFRVTGRLTVNAGLRWDMYVPWVEQNNQQSNFDVSTGRFVVASDSATINGVQVGRYLQTYGKTDFGPRLGFAYDLDGSGRTIVRGGYGLFWNFTPGGTSSSKAQNQPFLKAQANTTNFGTNIVLSQGLTPPPAVNPDIAPGGSTRSAFLVDFRDAHAHNFNINVQRQLGANYMVEAAYSGSRTRNSAIKTDLNQAPPIVGVNDQNVNRPYAAVSPALRSVGALSSTGYLEYNGLLVKFQRRSANHISFLNSYTFGRAIDLASDNDGTVTLTNIFNPEYNRGPADYDVRHTFSSNWIYELPWAAQKPWGGWQVSGILYLRSGLPVVNAPGGITQSQTMLSTGVSINRPNTICDPVLSNPTIDRWFNTSCFQQVPDTTGTFGNTSRNSVRGPGDFNVDVSAIKRTTIGPIHSELRLEIFNVLNHPQFANPNGQLGNAAFGTISAMLASPSCATCGTTERQIQLAVKLMF